jgi:DNA-binding HxlR family transcriptional regulator
MTEGSARQLGAVAVAAEILCTRWTMPLLRELVVGATRFNALRRALPRLSPSLLAKRLRELEEAGLVERRPADDDPKLNEYRLTPTGRDVQPVVDAMGRWGQRWIRAEASLRDMDPGLLMWDMRRHFDPRPMPKRRVVIAFLYPELSGMRRSWWLIVEPGKDVDLCAIDPGFDVDLHIVAELRIMTAIWLGLTSVSAARDGGKLVLTGDPGLAARWTMWLERGLAGADRAPTRGAARPPADGLAGMAAR